ncbi:MAG: NAD(P)/FAD-dependent oxidoreductase [Chromatiales bacterium]
MQAPPAVQIDPRALEFVDIPETLSTEDLTQHRVVIAGGGAAGLELATWLGRRLGKRKAASVTLVDRSRTHVWKPLLHEVASGSLDSEVDAIEFIPHAVKHGYRYRIGAMYGIDREKRGIYVEPSYDEEGQEVIPQRVIAYDTLVIAVGSICNDFKVPGAKEHAIALDTADEAARFNRKMINACLRANAQYEPLRPGQLHCAIVGAGATGVELAAELHKTMRDIAAHGLDHIDFDRLIKLTLIEAGPKILPPLPEHISRPTQQMLESLGVQILLNQRVTEVRADGVVLNGNDFLPAEMKVWAAGIKAPEFLNNLDGLEVDSINRLVVRETLQVTRDDNVFAIGDCSCCVPPGTRAPVPPRAQSAHQMAAAVYKSIVNRVLGKPPVRFRYQDFGSLVNLSEYGTFGNLFDRLSGRSVKVEGFMARTMYRSLYRMHLAAVHGPVKAGLDMLTRLITRRTEARVKLH